jgi:hypothetical protein
VRPAIQRSPAQTEAPSFSFHRSTSASGIQDDEILRPMRPARAYR